MSWKNYLVPCNPRSWPDAEFMFVFKNTSSPTEARLPHGPITLLFGSLKWQSPSRIRSHESGKMALPRRGLICWSLAVSEGAGPSRPMWQHIPESSTLAEASMPLRRRTRFGRNLGKRR